MFPPGIVSAVSVGGKLHCRERKISPFPATNRALIILGPIRTLSSRYFMFVHILSTGLLCKRTLILLYAKMTSEIDFLLLNSFHSNALVSKIIPRQSNFGGEYKMESSATQNLGGGTVPPCFTPLTPGNLCSTSGVLENCEPIQVTFQKIVDADW